MCDWVNDEQPYPMTTAAGELYALPLALELDDVHAMHDRRVPPSRYARLLVESAEVLRQDGKQNGRVMMIQLRPWLSGQPFRVGALDRALGDLMESGEVWAATGGDIIDWYREHPPSA